MRTALLAGAAMLLLMVATAAGMVSLIWDAMP